MARDNNRTQGDLGLDPTLAQKKRARHRLVGAVALCLLAALLIPLVLEAEPRHRVREVPIEIASRVKPVVSSAGSAPGVVASGSIGQRPIASAALAPVAVAPATVAPAAMTGAPARSTVVEVDSAKVGSAADESAGTPAVAAPIPRSPAARAAEKAAQDRVAKDRAAKDRAAKDMIAREKAAQDKLAQDRGARERAAAKAALDKPVVDARPDSRLKPSGDPLASLIERRDAGAAARSTSAAGAATSAVATAPKEKSRRFLIQIGAYGNVEGARAISDRVMSAGLRPYQETIRTGKGEVIRVRVGPFTTRESAEDAQRSLKAAGVTAAIVAL